MEYKTFSVHDDAFSEEMQTLIYWYKWKTEEPLFENKSVNIVDISFLLQIMGFQMKTLEIKNDDDNEMRGSDIEIQIKCNHSGLKSVLTKKHNECTCPLNIFSVPLNKLFALSPMNSTLIKGFLSRSVAIIKDASVKKKEHVVFSRRKRSHSLSALKNKNGRTSERKRRTKHSLSCEENFLGPSTSVFTSLSSHLNKLTLDTDEDNEMSDKHEIKSKRKLKHPRRKTRSCSSNTFQGLEQNKDETDDEEITPSQKKKTRSNSKSGLLKKTVASNQKSILQNSRKRILRKYLAKRTRTGKDSSIIKKVFNKTATSFKVSVRDEAGNSHASCSKSSKEPRMGPSPPKDEI